MKKLNGFIALALLPLVFVFTGCPGQSALASLTGILGTTAANVANLEGNTSLAQRLTTDTAAAVSAVQNWKSGTPAQNVVEALNLVEDDLNLFPVLSTYAPLVDLAIGTVDSILALLPSSSTTPTAAVASHVAHRHVALASPPKTASQYKKQWNAIVASNPSLASAKLK